MTPDVTPGCSRPSFSAVLSRLQFNLLLVRRLDRRVQELRHDRSELWRRKYRKMCRTGKNCEPRIRHTRSVPSPVPLPTAQEFEELNRVRGANGICISKREQHGQLDCCHVGGPIVVLTKQVSLAVVATIRAEFIQNPPLLTIAGVTITLIDRLQIIPSRARFHSVTRLHGGLHLKIARRYPQGYILGCAIRDLA